MAVGIQIIVIGCGVCGWVAFLRYCYKWRKKKQEAKNKVKDKLS